MPKPSPITVAGRSRPRPPDALVDALFGLRFAPAPELETWARETFIEEGGTLSNPHHAHLRDADVGFLWASAGFASKGRRVLGMTERPEFLGRSHAWANARIEQQLSEWFPHRELDFLITIDGHYSTEADDASFCALIEHELYHCGHASDEFGVPAFRKDGRPRFAIRGHDVEEFVGVAERYGANPDLEALVRALAAGPTLSRAKIAHACGTCALRIVA